MSFPGREPDENRNAGAQSWSVAKHEWVRNRFRTGSVEGIKY